MKNPLSSARRRGFTLIELLVAMAITTVIVAVLVSITGVAVDTWQRGRSEIRASRQAKSMLDTMAKDFESLVSRRGNNFEWLYTQVESQLPGPSANQSTNAAELIFFTAATDRYEGNIGGTKDLGGDVSAVGYQLKWQDPVQGDEDDKSATFVLYRLLVNPDQTFQDLLGKEDLEQAFSSKYSSKVADVENFVCENVYQFTLTYQVEVTKPASGGGAPQTFPVRVTLGDSGAGNEIRLRGNGIDAQKISTGSLSPQVTSEELKAGRLTGVEIGITVLSDSAVIRLNNAALDQKVREKILAQESFQYSRTVELPGM
ncbi:prepilin-type N-terminal cleavage/methylation domain-containing protein [Luteolibacter flavescens]|uniref:Prepilin-type N-terminal cleavage/methylation domain-containing protein n=1 Tax=Luteolibacter flavescens TaxID=1859460 RepID=A0ABT3FQP1_9BACT|nr:prepilin-type N-terminal cleavage/methylation domain-containing protein [Luteolibacter flavescens]MCW1885894.1 prepilin-type N-terminal cleavage/methylation domain-containing protein [Luteolibacter flavescens]